AMARVQPVYEELPGWRETSDARTIDELPAEARAFLARIEQVTGAPVSMVGVGREREALITLRDLANPQSPASNPAVGGSRCSIATPLQKWRRSGRRKPNSRRGWSSNCWRARLRPREGWCRSRWPGGGGLPRVAVGREG